jgi:uncharacterized membrane protein
MYTSMMRKAMLGDTATLNLDFTTGVLDSRLTFTRSGTGTYINSSGYVTTASTNVARFEYDPATLAIRGLLIEGSATNLLNWSETFATTGGTNNNWADTNLTRTSTNNTSPRNDATALQITASAGNGTIISSAAIGTSASRTLSVWLRRVTGTGNIQYTLDNGTNWTTQVITSSWVRYSFAATTAAQRVGFRIVTSGDAIELWGAQLEAGSGASSYIVTVASQVTRNADSCLMSGTNFSSWYTHGIGTVCWSGSVFRVTAGHLANINTVNNDPRITAYVGAGALTNLVTNPGTQVSMFFGSVTANTAFKAAWRFNTNDFAACLNAGTVYTDTLGTVPTGVDRMQLGAAEGGYQFLDGWIKSIKYYPTAFTNAQLQTATTL